jgi:hypothetical protein
VAADIAALAEASPTRDNVTQALSRLPLSVDIAASE